LFKKITTLIFVALFLALLPVSSPAESGSVSENVAARPKIALALGGGGTRGAAHVGVLRVLIRENIPIDYVAGTSIGAIIGGLYCAGVPVDRIEEMLLNRRMLHAFRTVPIPVRVAAIPVFIIPHIFGYRPYDGLYRGNKFRNYLDDQVPDSHRNIEDLHTPFCAVASNLEDGTAVAINKGNLGAALQASSAIPFLRRAVPLNNGLFVDGGVEANLPVNEARSMGGDIVIAVDVDEFVHRPVPEKSFRHILSVPPRVVSMLLARLDEEALKQADVVIHPDVDGITLLSSSDSDGRRAIAEGEKAAEAALPAIRARMAQAQATMANSGKQQ
jgi:NTE family protein